MGGGLPNIFQGIKSIFGGGTPQAAAAPAAGGAAGSAAQPTTGPDLGNIPIQSSFLDNPYLQGALGAYFGAISSPRYLGLGGAIGRGGLGGLQAYESARKEQYQPYLIGAQIAKEQAETGKATAEGKLADVRAGQIGGNLQHNNNLAASLRLSVKNNPNMDPQVRDQYLSIADSIEGDTSQAWNPSEVFSKPFDIGQKVAQTQEAQARTGEIVAKLPGELGIQQAQIERDRASTVEALQSASLTDDRRAELQAHVNELNQQAANLQQQYQYGGVKPKLETQTGPTGQQEEVLVGPGNKEPPGSYLGTTAPQPQGIKNLKLYSETFDKRYGTGMWDRLTRPQKEGWLRDQGIDPTTGQRLGTTGAPGGGAAPALPAGWKAGPPDASGRPTAVDPSGASHHWEG